MGKPETITGLSERTKASKYEAPSTPSPTVVFYINGEKHSVGPNTADVGPETILVDYIRDKAHLKGTKVVCREGGCGACIISAKVIDPVTGSEIVKSVNSCLTPVLSCDGWDISTVERLGNKHEGYHLIQNRLVSLHGTQCGYCTPGMVMNMYSLLGDDKNSNVRMEDVEKKLDGNICRCTGYRPILDAFKSLACDVSPELKAKCVDIEECATCPLKKKGGRCGNSSSTKASPHVLQFPSGEIWETAVSVEGALAAAEKCVESGYTYRFVAGNTSAGIFKNQGPFQVYIDTNGIGELRKTSVDKYGIVLGGGTSLSATINFLKESAKVTGLEYGEKVATHLERVANVSVRNNGTIAGNLMIKHAHLDFPSDVFVLLEAIGATLTIVSLKSKKLEKVSCSLLSFLKLDMTAKLILEINLPKFEGGYHFRSFKITKRYQNAHAYVNAGFLFKVDKSGGKAVVVEKPRIVYGGISSSFIHASLAESSFQGKNLADEKSLSEAFATLEKEVQPDEGPLKPHPKYSVHLTKTLLYKTILEILGDSAGPRLQSGGNDLLRKLNTSKQFIGKVETDSTLYKSIPKVEAVIQASGEAEYTGDIPRRPDELYAAFVSSTEGCADIQEIDPSPALEIPGVVKFISAKDIPGENNAMKYCFSDKPMIEPVFASDKVSYHGQSIGMILAERRDLAEKAAKLVKVTYSNVEKPVVGIEKALDKARNNGTIDAQTGGTFITERREDVKPVHKVRGILKCPAQYHFHMETQSVICYPREDGIDIISSTQWLDHVQNTVASVLNIPTNGINVQCRRVGGAFGAKVTRASGLASGVAVASWLTHRPVRLQLSLESNMSMIGKRLPYQIPYEVEFDEDGRIASLNLDLICDTGFTSNESSLPYALMQLQNVYKAVGWTVKSHFVLTNTPSSAFCRAPGSIQSKAVMEWIMDHIAHTLSKDPVEVRQVNLISEGDPLLLGTLEGRKFIGENYIPEMIELMKREAEYERRREDVDKFNRENRWKKRGMACVPVRFDIVYFWAGYNTSVAIYHTDGYVSVTHAGIEMGQGLNTKVVQTVAQILGIQVDRIKVKPTNNFVGANASPTAASATSEIICYSVMRACEQIRENLKPILEKLENPSWEKLVEEAFNAKVNLTATYTPGPNDDFKGYNVWLLNLVEVEIDVLTGEYKICRTDLYEDTGKSLSPGVDLGQIEGGYIFGQGYWTTERILHDENTGKLLTNGTWEYKPPGAKDIPEDFRITLLSKAPNPHGILRSKATGEPSVDAAFCAFLALRNAVAAARVDVGNHDWFEMNAPATPEEIARLCLTDTSHLSLKS